MCVKYGMCMVCALRCLGMVCMRVTLCVSVMYVCYESTFLRVRVVHVRCVCMRVR